MRVRIEALGDNAAFDRRLMRFSEHAANMEPAFASVALLFWQTEREQFDSGGEFSGGWAALAESTVKAKERHFLDPRILIATHALATALSSAVAPGSVYRVGPYEMFVGTDLRYAAAHQHGARKPGTDWVLPMRKPIEIPEITKRYMVLRLQNWLVRGEL